jgi:hypothetical protein
MLTDSSARAGCWSFHSAYVCVGLSYVRAVCSADAVAFADGCVGMRDIARAVFGHCRCCRVGSQIF